MGAVLHVALRHPDPQGYATGGRAVMPDILAERARMFAFAEDVRSGALRAAGGAPQVTATASTAADATADKPKV